MFLRRCTLRFAVALLTFLLAARMYGAAASPHVSGIEPVPAPSRLAFDQPLALADFDADDRTDQASLSGIGVWKNIAVSFSRTKSRTILSFRGEDYGNGSLFADDIDNDGDEDLVWTDLLHEGSVHVWENDGAGHFKSVPSKPYARQFILSDSPTTSTSGRAHSENAVVSPRTTPDFDYDSGFDPYVRIKPPDQKQRQFKPSSEARREPTNRGPPFLS